jgi:hypothetical protein
MIAPQHPSYISRVARAAGLPHLVPCILFSDGLDGPAVCCAIWGKPRRSLGKQLVGSNTSEIISVWCAAADCGCVTFLGTQHGRGVVPSNKQTLPLPTANIRWGSRFGRHVVSICTPARSTLRILASLLTRCNVVC